MVAWDGMPDVPRVLLLEPDHISASRIRSGLANTTVTCAQDTSSVAQHLRHSAFDCVIVPRDTIPLLERLGREVPRPTLVLATCSHTNVSGFACGPWQPDAALVSPLDAGRLARLIHEPFRDVRVALRQLIDLSLLQGDIQTAAPTVVRCLANVFGTDDCLLWSRDRNEPPFRAAADRSKYGGDEALLAQCEKALEAGVTIVASSAMSESIATLVAVPLNSADGTRLAALCLCDSRPRLFSAFDRELLHRLSQRLALELSWVSAHRFLVDQHEQLRESAQWDPLTGIRSRSAIEASAATQLALSVERDDDASLLLVDIDQLRHINERHGHYAGDAVLRHVARIVRGAAPSEDLVGRFGDDETALILPRHSLAAAQQVADTIVAAIAAEPTRHEDKHIPATVTAGVAEFRTSDHGPEPAFARALAAIKRAHAAHLPVMVESASQPDDETDAVPSGLELRSGTTLGGMYRVLHELSRGAMGVVYRAEDMGLGRPVAIKVLRFDLAQDQDLVARFRQEAAMLASLHHRHLVQVHSFATEGDQVYFVMELVEGQALADVLCSLHESGEHLAFEIVAKVVDEIADALEAMHTVGLIHRDVKPANILLDDVKERAVLVDVGVAKRREERGDAAGTPGFAAPESFTEADEMPSTDVYGLAATVYLMLTGCTPFGSGDVLDVVKRQLYESAVPPSHYRPEINEAIDAVVLKALAPDPHRRYSSAGAFSVALASALRRTKISRRPTTEDPAPPRAITEPMAAVSAPSEPPPKHFTLRAAPVVAHPSQRGHVRGAIFRVARSLLARHSNGQWLRDLSDSELGEALQPTLSPTSWQPLELLVELLEQTETRFGSGAQLAVAVGKATMSATFARFFGADPLTLTPGAVLGAAESYWSLYHTWSTITVTGTKPGHRAVALRGDPVSPYVCLSVAASFARIAELSGATDVSCDHTQCACTGSDLCELAVVWH